VSSVLTIAAPFLMALTVAWAVLGVHHQPLAWRSTAMLWVATLVGGMLARRLVFQRGTAASFVLVASLTLGVSFFGWRAIARSRIRACS
jgi:hypothetical protein